MPKASATSVNFADRCKQAEQAGLIGSGDYLKLKEGGNKMRLLTECLPHSSSYQGKPTFKWLCYVIDRQDGKVKPFFMPHTIYKSVEALQQSDDYAFESVPMPYDITINAKGAGTIDVEYGVVPARNNKELSLAEQVLLDGVKPLAELQAAFRSKNKGKTTSTSHDDDGDNPFEPKPFDPDEIPF